jgi:hypothetical protein
VDAQCLSSRALQTTTQDCGNNPGGSAPALQSCFGNAGAISINTTGAGRDNTIPATHRVNVTWYRGHPQQWLGVLLMEFPVTVIGNLISEIVIPRVIFLSDPAHPTPTANNDIGVISSARILPALRLDSEWGRRRRSPQCASAHNGGSDRADRKYRAIRVRESVSVILTAAQTIPSFTETLSARTPR